LKCKEDVGVSCKEEHHSLVATKRVLSKYNEDLNFFYYFEQNKTTNYIFSMSLVLLKPRKPLTVDVKIFLNLSNCHKVYLQWIF